MSDETTLLPCRTTELLRKLLDERGVSCQTHYLHASWCVGSKLYEAVDNLDGTLTVGNFTPEQAIAATLGSDRESALNKADTLLRERGSGTLTAEQVREAIERHSAWAIGNGPIFRDGAYEEIADELNARTERTCRDANTRFNAWTCSECKCTLLLMFDDYGEPTLNVDGVASVPNYCPNCGAKVRNE